MKHSIFPGIVAILMIFCQASGGGGTVSDAGLTITCTSSDCSSYGSTFSLTVNGSTAYTENASYFAPADADKNCFTPSALNKIEDIITKLNSLTSGSDVRTACKAVIDPVLESLVCQANRVFATLDTSNNLVVSTENIGSTKTPDISFTLTLGSLTQANLGSIQTLNSTSGSTRKFELTLKGQSYSTLTGSSKAEVVVENISDAKGLSLVKINSATLFKDATNLTSISLFGSIVAYRK